MAVLGKDDFIARVKARLGEELTDEDIAFLEDMTDTYEDLEGRVGEDWKGKYDALDREWREKYVERFNSGSGIDYIEDAKGDVEVTEEEDVYVTTYEELFNEGE